MTVYIRRTDPMDPRNPVYPSYALLHMLALTDEDLALGQVNYDADRYELTYSLSPGNRDPLRQVIDTLVNGTQLAYDVEIVATDSSYLIGGLYPITATGGVTVQMGSTQLCVYDASECNGNFFHVFAADGTQILEPSFLLLAHELGHAFHRALGTENVNAPEPQAILIENWARGRDIGGPERDPSSDRGGCGLPVSTGVTPNQPQKVPELKWIGPKPKCFLVAAAYGSQSLEAVRVLQEVRDNLLRGSLLGDYLVADIFEEYYAFSPWVAETVDADSETARRIRTALVEPLLAFFAAVQAYVKRGDLSTVELTAQLDEEILDSQQAVIREIETVANRYRRDRPLVTWALLEPVRGYVYCMLASPDEFIRRALLLKVISDWISRLPVSLSYLEQPVEVILSDVRDFFASTAFSPHVREQILRQLAAAGKAHSIPGMNMNRLRSAVFIGDADC